MSIKEDSLVKELKEKYFIRTGRKIEEFGYYIGSTDVKEKEPEYLEHKELKEKLEYLNRILINNLGELIIKSRNDTDSNIAKIEIYNCFTNDHCWRKLNIGRDIHCLIDDIVFPTGNSIIGIASANVRYSDILENLIRELKRTAYLEEIAGIYD